MKKTYLEFRGGGSSKFWEITVDGSKHTVRFGKIGTEGRSQTKGFKTPALATKDADALTSAKLKKGYAASKASASSKTAKPAAKTAKPGSKAAKPESKSTKPTAAKSNGKRDMTAMVEELIALATASEPEFPPKRRKPATKQQIEALEKAWKRPLPPSYRAFLEVTNGIDELSLRLVGTEDQKWAKRQLNGLTEYWDGFDTSKVFPLAIPDADDGIHNFAAFDATKKGDELPVVDWDNGKEHQRFKSFEAYLEDDIKQLKRMAEADARGGKPKFLAAESSKKGKADTKFGSTIPKSGPERDAAFGAVFKLKTTAEVDRATALLVAANPSADELDDYFEAAEENIIAASDKARGLAYACADLLFHPTLKTNKAFLKGRVEFCKIHLEYIRKVDPKRAARWADLLRADLVKDPGHAWGIAIVYALVGRKDDAIAMVEAALKGGLEEHWRNKMQKDPDLASIAKDPRFHKLFATTSKGK